MNENWDLPYNWVICCIRIWIGLGDASSLLLYLLVHDLQREVPLLFQASLLI